MLGHDAGSVVQGGVPGVGYWVGGREGYTGVLPAYPSGTHNSVYLVYLRLKGLPTAK